MSYRKNFYRGPKPTWSSYTDQQLLDLRFCDLKLRAQDTVFPERMERLYRELSKRGIGFRPHYWLSQEWFSPVGIPGIAIPFFIAHPRLMKLEDRQVLEVEGGTESWCMQLIRHEAGHAIDAAYRLHRRKRWRQLFGSNSKTYPDFYRAKPMSRHFVRHLDSWYAQAHPAEDFAETFAVWLQPGKPWRRHYRDWPALKKLEYVDELMKEIAGKPAPVRSRRQMSPLPKIKTTLREYYEKKRAHYMPGEDGIPDPDLLRLFSRGKGRRKAAAFLRRVPLFSARQVPLVNNNNDMPFLLLPGQRRVPGRYPCDRSAGKGLRPSPGPASSYRRE